MSGAKETERGEEEERFEGKTEAEARDTRLPMWLKSADAELPVFWSCRDSARQLRGIRPRGRGREGVSTFLGDAS